MTTMPSLPILFADAAQVVQVAVLLLLFLGPFLFRLFGSSDRQADRPMPRRPQPPRPQPARPKSNQDAEIEEFLRRANTRRGGNRPAEVELIEPAAARRPIGGRTREPLVRDMEIVEAQVVPSGQVGTGVKSTINTSDIRRHVESLGDRVEMADDAMEARLHSVFDHDLGNLSETPIVAATAGFSPSAKPSDSAQKRRKVATGPGLLAQLRTPRGMRDAIVLREILERPESRW